MYQFSDRIQRVKGDALKQLLAMLADPTILSLGGGAPAKESFDVEAISAITAEVLAGNNGRNLLQYGQTLGYAPLREAYINHLLAPKGVKADVDNVAIFTGSTQAIFHVFDIFLNEGDTVLIENPTYLATINVLQKFNANMVAVETDEGGIILEDLEDKIKKHHPKLLYTIPTFQNPTGRTIPADRRKRIAELASEYNFMVLEDDPYGELRYRGEAVAPIKTFDQTGNVILMNSFSKIISPGIRIGTAVADPAIIQKLEVSKQGVDMHSALLTQAIATEFLNRGLLPDHLKKICRFYEERFEALLNGVKANFPASVQHTMPEGGMFIWATIPGLDTTRLLERSIAECKVSFVPGCHFCLNPADGANSMRINFSGVAPADLAIATEKLGQLIAKELA